MSVDAPSPAAARTSRAYSPRRSQIASGPSTSTAACAPRSPSPASTSSCRARSDPRYLSYAEAALGPFWDLPSPPNDVLVLRATVRQSVHDFDRVRA